MSKFSRHIGNGEKLVIDGDEFILKPLGIEYGQDFINISKGFSGSDYKKDKDGKYLLDDKGEKIPDTESVYKNFNDETMTSIKRVVIETLTQAYPEEDKSELDTFAGKYLTVLLPFIQKINSGSVDKDSRARQKLDTMLRIKAKQNEFIKPDKE